MNTPQHAPRPESSPGPGTTPELAEELRISVARLSRRLRSVSAGAPAGTRPDGSPQPARLTMSQHAVLAVLERHRSMTPRELADHERVQPPSMTRVIAALEEQGLVERSPHPTDGRQVVLRVTERGTRLLEEERRRKEAWLSQRLRELTPQEREILHQAAPILDRLSKS
ncbi:DNA-binding transcriptional regulator, MarR family [Thermomonospora echinospora]|uniref:DNA-binding transcriptional regulator, MarR family n=1 Tax=Thermomonospora echinospora TaxID=1992 RepID=A0A1H6E3V9_9ACTN|nr:MarR family transcriptional regulator [Thermomonospora echinospora]SEG92388.1 DNA-binding transcriptional regulator, MarR family [Thermomonospora echinospora]